MKAIRICVVVGLAVLLLGQTGKKTDVAKLRPIEVIRIQKQGTTVIMETDTQDCGRGNSVQDALENLRKTTPGEVFLETADYLIVDAAVLQLIPELAEVLRPNCKLSMCEDQIDLREAADYLRVHEPWITLREYAAGIEETPILKCTEGKIELVQK